MSAAHYQKNVNAQNHSCQHSKYDPCPQHPPVVKENRGDEKRQQGQHEDEKAVTDGKRGLKPVCEFCGKGKEAHCQTGKNNRQDNGQEKKNQDA